MALQIQTSCPDRKKCKSLNKPREGNSFKQFKSGCCSGTGRALPSRSHQEVGLSLSYRCSAAPGGPPGGYGAARLSLDFAFLSKVAPGTADLFSCVAPPPGRDWLWLGRRGARGKQTAACVRVPGQTLQQAPLGSAPDPCDSHVNKAAFPELRGGPSVKARKYREI